MPIYEFHSNKNRTHTNEAALQLWIIFKYFESLCKFSKEFIMALVYTHKGLQVRLGLLNGILLFMHMYSIQLNIFFYLLYKIEYFFYLIGNSTSSVVITTSQNYWENQRGSYE